MRTLTLGTLEAVVAGGPDREGGGTGPAVVLLHGYGAPGGDLVPLYRAIAAPRAVRFVFPAAPIVLERSLPPAFAPRAWWPLDMAELMAIATSGRIEDLQAYEPAELDAARQHVAALLDAVERELSVAPEQIVLGGFSQGAMLATDFVLRSERPFAGLVAFSGTLMCKRVWSEAAPARRGLRVVQSHGRADPILPYANAEALRDLLVAAGLAVEFCPFAGGHGIPDAALERLSALLQLSSG